MSLSDVSLDGKPITQEWYHKQIVLQHMHDFKSKLGLLLLISVLKT